MNWQSFGYGVLTAALLAGIGAAVMWHRVSVGDSAARATIEALKKREKEITAKSAVTQAEYQHQIEELRKEAKKKLPPKEVVREVVRYIPQAGPIEIVMQEPTGELTEPFLVAELPLPQLEAIRQFAITCEECKVSLAACSASLEAEQELSKLAREERDVAIKNMKGGGFWRRLARGAKWFGVGVVAGSITAVVLLGG